GFNRVYWNRENDGTLHLVKNTCPLQMYTFSEFLMDLNFGDETRYDIYYNTYRGLGIPDILYYFILVNKILWPDPIHDHFDIYDETLVNQIKDLITLKGDGAVAQGSAILSGAVNNRGYWWVAHGGIVNYPEVQKDILWDLKHYPEVEIDVESPMNHSYYELMDGYYPGTNSFDHNKVGYRPDWFDTIDTDGGTVQYIEELDGHNKVLELTDTNNGSDLNV
ncbi:unnamed protein product, partial [marine sediment metagenome]